MPAYDPKKVSFTWGTVQAVQYGEDSMIKASLNEDEFSYQPSATGGGARSYNQNRSGRFEVTLKVSSPTNDGWMIQHSIDRATGAGALQASCKDVYTGQMVAAGQNVWCVKVPDIERGKTVGDVTWVFETDLMDLRQGGVPVGPTGIQSI